MVSPDPSTTCGRAVEHRVERLFTRLAQTAGLVVSADHKDRVVRSGGDRHQHEHVIGERGEPHDAVVSERRDDTAGRGQLDEDHHQHDQNGDYRAVDEQQHHHNHEEGDHGDCRDALLARVGLVGKQRSRPGDVGLDPRRRRHRVDDLADGVAGLGGQPTAHVAGEVDLDVRGFLVVTLGARGGQGITPEILDVLNVLLVLLESPDDLVVIAMSLRPERLVTLQQDHRRAVGVELFERRPDAHHRLERCRVRRTHRHRVGFGDDLQLRRHGVGDEDDAQPHQDDRQRHPVDHPRQERRDQRLVDARRNLGGLGGLTHADLSRQ